MQYMDNNDFKAAVGASFLDDSRRDALRREPGYGRVMDAITLLKIDKKAAYEKYPDLKDFFDESTSFFKAVKEELND